MNKYYMRQKAVRDAINRMKVDDFKKYAELVYRATHEEEIEAKELEEEQHIRRERLYKFGHSLVVTDIPVLWLSGVEGMVAFRTWDVSESEDGLFLRSTSMGSVWESQMIADKIPTAQNSSGLYCVKLDPLGLMTKASYYLDGVCGLVELRGKVLEHTDSVVRAEWARIICVFIQPNAKTEVNYGGLRQSYPTVPFYVLHTEQIAEVLVRVTMLQSMREVRNAL